jgi:hypothetical protein
MGNIQIQNNCINGSLRMWIQSKVHAKGLYVSLHTFGSINPQDIFRFLLRCRHLIDCRTLGCGSLQLPSARFDSEL